MSYNLLLIETDGFLGALESNFSYFVDVEIIMLDYQDRYPGLGSREMVSCKTDEWQCRVRL